MEGRQQSSMVEGKDSGSEHSSHQYTDDDSMDKNEDTEESLSPCRFFLIDKDQYIVQHHPNSGPNGRRPRTRVIYTIHGNPIPMSYINDRKTMKYSGDELELWTELIRSCRGDDAQPCFVGEGVTVVINVYLTSHIQYIEMNLLVEIVPQLLRMMVGILFESDTMIKSVVLDKSYSNDLVGSMEIIVSNLE